MMNDQNIVTIEEIINLHKEKNDMKKIKETFLQRLWRRTRIIIYFVLSIVLGLGAANFNFIRLGASIEDIYIGVVVVCTMGFALSIYMIISSIDVAIQKAIRLIKHDNQIQKERRDKIELLKYMAEVKGRTEDGKETA